MKQLPFILLTFLLAAAVPALGQEPRNGDIGIVTAPVANVHRESAPKSGLVTQVLLGDDVIIREKQNNRFRIVIPGQADQEGWIQQEAVQIPKDRGRAYLNSSRQWIVITKPKAEAMIRHRTGDHKVPLYAGTRLPVLSRTEKAYTVQLPDRSEAIIGLESTMPALSSDPLANDTRPEDIARTAMQFQRVRHLAGGITAQGMDTAGLIYISYRIHGILLSTDPASLQGRAKRIDRKDIEPGDVLVFFGEGQGLAAEGGRFLHAPRKSTVQASGMHDRRYAASLQYGLRFLAAGIDEQKRLSAMTADEVLLAQARIARHPIGKRVTYWAGRMIGTPYDPDPMGLYVRTGRIIADEKADCMYHTFRAVELAQTRSPAEAVEKALDLRFLTKGVLADGLVTNYDQRFEYGEDMVMSNKWGRNITADLGKTASIAGSRGRDAVDILPKNVLASRALQKKLQDGDIIYWVKDPKKRVVGEIVAHLSIVHLKSGKISLIHASGDKDREGRPGGGIVKAVSLGDYLRTTKFIGAFVTRFEQ